MRKCVEWRRIGLGCTFLGIIFLALFLAGQQTQKEHLDFPFPTEEVQSISLYRYGNTEAEPTIQKKVVTGEDVGELIESICRIPVQRDQGLTSKNIPAVTYSFRFHLAGGTEYELFYFPYGVKKGLIVFPGEYNLQTIADVGGIWESYGVTE